MVLEKLLRLSRLRRAMKKLQFYLNFNLNRWRLASIIGRSSQRRLSFNDRPGLYCCTDENYTDEAGSSSRGLQRTQSSLSDEDVDNRAEMFIANFYRQLQMERQVSLKLHYCRGNSMESTRSD